MPRTDSGTPRGKKLAFRRPALVASGLIVLAAITALIVSSTRWGGNSDRRAFASDGTSGEEDAVIEPALEEIEPPIEVGQVTFASDVARILQDRCQTCHRPGQSAPFSLLTYDDARAHGAMIQEVVQQHRMPPWHADKRYGTFANDRRLNPRERATLLAWIDQGAPLGDPVAIPRERRFAEGWSIGTPDVILTMSEPYVVAPQGVLPYQYFRVSTHFTEDKWVQAVEARPGDRQVVHHFIVRIEVPGQRIKHHGQQPYLVGYAPGDIPSIYEPGTAKRIPAGADLIFAVHYTPIGEARTDRSSIALIFAREPVRHEATTQGISQEKFLIPPGAARFPVRSRFVFKDDAHLLNLMPHMHLRGKSFRYRATYPDGRTETLLSVPAYDFGWQSVYRLAEPRAMPRGTRIDCLALFDNSTGNPNNPDPSKAVAWGDQTYDEMMIGFIDYALDAPAGGDRGSRPPWARSIRSPR